MAGHRWNSLLLLRQEHWVPTSVSNVVQGGNTVKVVNQYAVPMRDDYSYDPINRITQVQGWQRTTGTATPAQIYQQTYSYDKFGNRKLDQAQTWGTGINGSVAADIYDVDKPTNRLAGMVYDAAGNLVKSKPISPQPENRTYDAENRMTFAQLNGGTGYYVYDGDGRRVRRIANGVENWQVYGIDGELLAEYQWNGTTASLKKEYGYRDGQLLVVADPTETNANKRVQWLIADHLGTPRLVVDKTGSLSGVTRHDYLPFGEELMVGMGNGSIRSTGMGYQADSVRQKFTGYERDTETDLDFAQARFYSNKQGRFTSPDPFLASAKISLPQSWNRYSYVLNRPFNYTDPTGLDPQEDEIRRLQQETERLRQETARLQEDSQRIQGELNGSLLPYQEPTLLDSVGSVTMDFAVIGAIGANGLSENGLRFIAQWEAFVANPYNDAANHATIGYGHLMHEGPVTDADIRQYPNGITQNQAMGLLRQDAAIAEAAVRDNVTVALNQNQFDALASFTFNVGAGAFRGSTLLREVNAGNFDAVPDQMGRWVNAGGRRLRGLENRRAAEGALFGRQGR